MSEQIQPEKNEHKKDLNLPVCRVNDESISIAHVQDIFNIELDNYYKDKEQEKLTDEQLNELFLETLYSVIYEKLIIQQAKKENLIIEDSVFKEEKENFIKKFGQDVEFHVVLDDRNLTEKEFDQFLTEELFLKEMLKKYVYSNIDLSDDAVKRYYEENKEILAPKKLYKLRQLKIDKNGYEHYKDLIENKLNNNTSFEKIVKMYSRDNYKTTGGLLEPLPLDVFEESIQQGIKETGVGEHTGFIEYGQDYYMYYIEDIIQVNEKQFDEIKTELSEILKTELYNEYFYNYVDGLMEEADIEFYEENLKKFLH